MRFETMHPALQLVEMMNRVYESGLTTTSGGNLSIRDTNGDIYITPTSIDKGRLSKDVICRVLPDGTIEGPFAPSVELPFHQHIYRIRPDISAILHAHPPGLVGYSLARKNPATDLFPGAAQVIGGVSMAKYEVPGSLILGEQIAKEFEKGNDSIMMENHGVVVGKKDMQSAFKAFELLDYTARTQVGIAALRATARHLSKDDCGVSAKESGLSPVSFGPMSAREKELRQELAYLSKRACEHGLFSSAFGEFSARIDQGSFLISPLAGDRRTLEPEDFVRVEANGYETGKTPDAGVYLHLLIYRQQPDIMAVTVARPPSIMAFACSDAEFNSRTIPESYIMLRFPAELPFGSLCATPDTLAAQLSFKTPVALVENEGFVTIGNSPVNAYDRLEVGEYSARSLINCAPIGSAFKISDEEIQDINKHFNIEA